jgi:hypothetical protein
MLLHRLICLEQRDATIPPSPCPQMQTAHLAEGRTTLSQNGAGGQASGPNAAGNTLNGYHTSADPSAGAVDSKGVVPDAAAPPANAPGSGATSASASGSSSAALSRDHRHGIQATATLKQECNYDDGRSQDGYHVYR